MQFKVKKIGSSVYMGVIVSALCLILMAPYSAANNVPPDAVLVGSDACADCHADVSSAFKATVHGLGFKDDQSKTGMACESCHGPGSAHIEEGEPSLIVNPAKSSQFDIDQTCLSCHKTDEFDGWMFTSHSAADLNCSSCHKVHTDQDYRMKQTPDLCYDCHTDVRAAFNMPSHHPVAEGKMDCQSCHPIHGGDQKFTMDFSKQELCFSCHPEKEGPFVYEHAPVTEDCMVCHTPHGAVANNLLAQNEPTLCLNCHAMHFHATVDGFDGEFTPPLNSGRTSLSTPDGWKQAMLTKCTQCHTEVHGTDMPSQSISTGGNALTR